MLEEVKYLSIKEVGRSVRDCGRLLAREGARGYNAGRSPETGLTTRRCRCRRRRPRLRPAPRQSPSRGRRSRRRRNLSCPAGMKQKKIDKN